MLLNKNYLLLKQTKRHNKNVLDMNHTKKILGIKSQSLSSVINDLFTEYKNKQSDQYLYEN